MSEEKMYLSKGSDAAPPPAKVLDWARGVGAKMVDLKFTDLLGTWQHVSLPLAALDEERVRGRPRLRRLVDPWLEGDPGVGHALDPGRDRPRRSTRSPPSRRSRSSATIQDPITREAYDRDPRLIAKRAEAYLVETGIADTVYFGPEAEFFVFDNVSYELDREPRPLRGRFERGLLELGRARRRLHDPREARLLPGLAARHAPGICAPRWC